MFWDKFCNECQKAEKSINAVSKELSISKGSIQKYREGVQPSGAVTSRIAHYFGVSMEYLLNDDIEVNGMKISPADKKDIHKSLDSFSSLTSLGQRFVSLRHGKVLDSPQIKQIAEYVNCEESFLQFPNENKYTPLNPNYDKKALLNTTVHDEILSLFDRCAHNERNRVVQLQLSKIVLHWLSEEGYTSEIIKSWNETLFNKVDYISEHKEHFDPTYDYGFNFSELDYFCEKTGLSFQYMLTGEKVSPAEISAEEVTRKKNKEIAELHERLAKYENKIGIE